MPKSGYLLGFIILTFVGFVTMLAKVLNWYMLGPIETGSEAIRSGIALVVIGFAFGYAYFRKTWRISLMLLKKLHPINLIFLVYIVNIILAYYKYTDRHVPGLLGIFSLTLMIVLIIIYDNILTNHFEQNKHRDRD